MVSALMGNVSVRHLRLCYHGLFSRCGVCSSRIQFGRQRVRWFDRQFVCHRRFVSSTKYPGAFRLSVRLDVGAAVSLPIAFRLVQPKRIGFDYSADGSSL